MLIIIQGLNKQQFVTNVTHDYPTDEHAAVHLDEITIGGIKFRRGNFKRAWLPVFEQVETRAQWEERWIRELADKYGYPQDEKNLREPWDVTGMNVGDWVCFRNIYAVTPSGVNTDSHVIFTVMDDKGGIFPNPIFDGEYKNCHRKES